MERDFMGLNSKDEEGVPTNGFKDNNNNSVFMRGSGMQWPFSSNKVSALPQFMSYKNAQEDRSKKIMFDPVVSSGYAEAYDANQRMFNGVVQQQQKSFSFDRQGSNHYPMNTYPIQHVDPHSVQRPHDMRTFSIPNHTVSISNTNPFFKGHISTTGHNYASGSMKQQQPLGGIPITSPHSVVPVMRSVPGNVEQRNISKPLPPFAQLTIFYGGMVNVYDDISPEKAQAIMYLAGNGATSNANIATPRTQVQALPPKPIGSDGAHVNQTAAHANQTAAHLNQTYPSVCSGLSSPLSITSLPSPQSRSGSSGTDELMTAKPLSDLTAPSNQSEPANPVKLVPAAVPQARKASLARFLEKRKERVIATMPYNLEKKSFDGSTTPGSSYINVAGNPELGFVEASREQAWSIGPPINNRPFDGSTTPGSDIINVSGNSEVGFIPASKEQSWSLSLPMNERNSKSLQPTLGM